MTYLTAEARQRLLDDMPISIEELALALALLGAAYELLDEQTADRMEEQLFRGVQTAFGRAQRTHAAFAARYSLQGRTFEQPSAGLPSQGARAFLDARARRSPRPTRCSPSSRTRCCPSRSATPSCAPAWPRSARSWASSGPRAAVREPLRPLESEDGGDGLVNRSHLRSAEAAGGVAKTFGAHRGRLLDEHAGRRSVKVDDRAKCPRRSGLRRWCDQYRAQRQQLVRLYHDSKARARAARFHVCPAGRAGGIPRRGPLRSQARVRRVGPCLRAPASPRRGRQGRLRHAQPLRAARPAVGVAGPTRATPVEWRRNRCPPRYAPVRGRPRPARQAWPVRCAPCPNRTTERITPTESVELLGPSPNNPTVEGYSPESYLNEMARRTRKFTTPPSPIVTS